MKPQTLTRAALYGVFGTWLAGTIVCQDPFRREDRIRNYDRFNLVFPDWRFFAPNPGIHDYHLLYRDRGTAGAMSEWSEIGHIESRRPRHALWHPHRRLEKTLFDIVAEILRFMGETDRETDLALSVPYLTLLNYLNARAPHAVDAEATQFLLAASGGHDETEEPTMLFLSEFHPLTSGSDRSQPEIESAPAGAVPTEGSM